VGVVVGLLDLGGLGAWWGGCVGGGVEGGFGGFLHRGK